MTNTIQKTTSITTKLVAACAIFYWASSPIYVQTADANAHWLRGLSLRKKAQKWTVCWRNWQILLPSK